MDKELTAEGIELKYGEIEKLPGGFGTDRTHPLGDLSKAAEKLGNKDLAEQLRTEAAAFFLTPYGKTFSGHFQPTVVYVDGSTSPPLDFFTEERLQRLAKRAKKTTSPVHAAHFADVYWDLSRKKDPELARLAIDKYIECVDSYWKAGDGLDAGQGIKRAAELAAKIKDAARLAAVKTVILARLEELDKRKEYRYSLDLADALEKINLAPEDGAQKRTLEILSNGAAYYREEHPAKEGSFGPIGAPNEHFVRSFTERKLALTKLWKRKDVTAEISKLEEAQSYEREADKAPNPLAKLVFLQNAEKLYGESGKTAEQERIRVAMGKAGKLAESEMKRVGAEASISHAEADEYIKPLFGANLAESLKRLSAAPQFIPDLKTSKEAVAQRKKEFPLQAIMPRVFLKEGHIVGKAASEEELFDSAVIRDYVMTMQIGGVIRSRFFERLASEQGLSKDGLIAHFRAWGYCKEKHLAFLTTGIDHYFKGDFTSAIHVLVPQFEDMLRGFLEQAGQPISDPQRGKFILLDSLLKNPTLVGTAGEDLITWYKLSLSDPEGMNLRNDVAHGLSSPEVMNKQNAELVLHLLLSLTRFQLEEKKAAAPTEPGAPKA